MLDERRLLADLKEDLTEWQWQSDVTHSNIRHVLMRAARRIGKSRTGARRAFIKKVIYPNTRGWIVGPSYDLAHKEFRYILDLVQRFCRLTKQPMPHPVRENPGAGDLYLKTAWGAEVIGKSAQKPETLVGEELDWALMAEAALHKQETWERYIRPTLSTRNGISIWPFTPDAGGLWLYELEQRARTQSRTWGVYHCAAWDCPHYDPKEIAQAKEELSEDAFYEQYGGEWRFYTGRVYKMVRPDVHVVPAFEVPTSWRVYATTDFGYRDPTATGWLAVSQTGEGYWCAEYYARGETIGDHVKAMQEIQGKLKLAPFVRIADHHGLGKQLIVEATKAGWPTVSCRSDDRRARRERAITTWTRHTRPHPYHVREGLVLPPPETTLTEPSGPYPDCFLMKGRCPNLEREMQFLRWKETVRQEGAAGVTEGDDHAIDFMEYGLEYANLGVVARARRGWAGKQRDWRMQPGKALHSAPRANRLTGY